MKYLVIVPLLIVSAYPFSYVRYVWSKKNYAGALGMAFLTLASIVFPAWFIFSR